MEQQTRRQFLTGAAALAAAKSNYDPKLAVQLYVWTQQFRAEKIGLAEGMEKAFPACRRAGYHRLELMAGFVAPDLRERTKALLQKNDLQAPIMYSGGVLHEERAAEKAVPEILKTADAARDLGAVALNVNPDPKPRREPKSDEELNTQARYLNRLGRELANRGLRLFVHNHDPEMLENAREWRSNLQHTDPRLVWFCLDLHWVYRGKQDPMALLRQAGSRLASLHIRNSVKGTWSESFGDGDIDYREITKFLKQIEFAGFLVLELAYEKATKVTRPLEENLRLSRLYAEKIFDLNV